MPHAKMRYHSTASYKRAYMRPSSPSLPALPSFRLSLLSLPASLLSPHYEIFPP